MHSICSDLILEVIRDVGVGRGGKSSFLDSGLDRLERLRREPVQDSHGLELFGTSCPAHVILESDLNFPPERPRAGAFASGVRSSVTLSRSPRSRSSTDGAAGMLSSSSSASAASLESVDALTDEVDLEALAAEAEELEDNIPAAPSVDDLDLGDLESVTDDLTPDGKAAAAEAAPEEIEIAFEDDVGGQLKKSRSSSPSRILNRFDAEDALDGESPESETASASAASADIPDNLKDEIRTVLKYMDHLLEALPDEKIQEFASSDYFVMYKKLFEDLGLGE